jgi:hypothetical protein
MRESLRYDMRRMRAQQVLGYVMEALNPVFDRAEFDPHEIRRDTYDALAKLFMQEGVELLTEYHRQEMGLPPRGPDGWTVEEIIALEQRHLDALLRPIFVTLPKEPTP